MGNVQHTFLTIDGVKVPVKIYRERRRGIRASIGKKAAILRLPILISKNEEEKRIQWFTEWLAKQFTKHIDLIEQFRPKTYQSGDLLTVGRRTYKLQINQTDRKNPWCPTRRSDYYIKLKSIRYANTS